MTTIEKPDDVVTFLKAQHLQIEQLMDEVSQSRGETRQAAWDDLRRLLAVHETAEEEVVHPRARKVLDDGEELIEERLEEEHEGKKAIAELEELDVDSAEFDTKFAQLVADVKKHAAAEERTEFERLGDALEHEQLVRMRKAVELAEATAPTRPHPGVESRAANILVGPFAAMMDRARDAISS